MSLTWGGPISGGQVITVGPSGFRSVDLSRGFHTLTIVIDPGNHVAETDETDNASGTTFVCFAGSAQPGRVNA